MTSLTNHLKSVEEKTDSRISQIENKLKNINKSIDQRVKSGIKDVTPVLVDKIKNDIRFSLQDDFRKEIREIEDQKRRTLNLVIFHSPESMHSDPIQRKEEDEHKFYELCNCIGVDKPDVKTIFRLGNQTHGKIRATKAVLNNKVHRKNIQDNLSKIKDLPKSTGLSRCIILKDLTVSQQELNKEKRKKKLRSSNNSNSEEEYEHNTICDPHAVEMEVNEEEDGLDNLKLGNASFIQPNQQFTQNNVNSQLLLQDSARINQTLNFDDTIIGRFNTQTETRSDLNPNIA